MSKEPITLNEALKKVIAEFGNEYCTVHISISKHVADKPEIKWSVYVHNMGSSDDVTNLEAAIFNLKDKNGLIEHEQQEVNSKEEEK